MIRPLIGLLTVALLAGCGASSSTPTGAGGNPSASTDPCTWLTTSEVTDIIGSAPKGVGVSMETDGGAGCVWSTGGGMQWATSDFVLIGAQSPALFTTPFNPLKNDRVPVSGVGDSAYFLIANIGGQIVNSSNELHVLAGSHGLVVTVWRGTYNDDTNALEEQKQAETAAARIVLPRVG